MDPKWSERDIKVQFNEFNELHFNEHSESNMDMRSWSTLDDGEAGAWYWPRTHAIFDEGARDIRSYKRIQDPLIYERISLIVLE